MAGFYDAPVRNHRLDLCHIYCCVLSGVLVFGLFLLAPFSAHTWNTVCELCFRQFPPELRPPERRRLWRAAGPRTVTFQATDQCLYCSARNAGVVLTIQWLGKTQLRPSALPQTCPTGCKQQRGKKIPKLQRDLFEKDPENRFS